MNCKKKIENTLNLWNGLRFNMIDKVTVIRTFGLSKPWYLLNFITIAEQDIKDYKRLTFNYILANKVETIKSETIMSEFKAGG